MPDPSNFAAVGWLIVALASLIGAINQIDAFVKRRSGKEDQRQVGPQPFVIKTQDEYVTRRAFETHIAQMARERDQLHARLGGMERGLREEMKADIEKLHEKVNATNLGVARVETETRAQSTMLNQMREDLHEFMKRG